MDVESSSCAKLDYRFAFGEDAEEIVALVAHKILTSNDMRLC